MYIYIYIDDVGYILAVLSALSIPGSMTKSPGCQETSQQIIHWGVYMVATIGVLETNDWGHMEFGEAPMRLGLVPHN